jgi:hypothetical protein
MRQSQFRLATLVIGCLFAVACGTKSDDWNLATDESSSDASSGTEQTLPNPAGTSACCVCLWEANRRRSGSVRR